MEVTEEPTSTEVETSDDIVEEPDDHGTTVEEPDDNGPTVEEEYEITTTRRKTVRTSYKIQEVSFPPFSFSFFSRSFEITQFETFQGYVVVTFQLTLITKNKILVDDAIGKIDDSVKNGCY